LRVSGKAVSLLELPCVSGKRPNQYVASLNVARVAAVIS